MAFTITGSYEITGEPGDIAAAEHDPHRHPRVQFDDVEDLIDGTQTAQVRIDGVTAIDL